MLFCLGPPKTYKYMRSKWILIGQSFLKTMRTIGTKKSLLGEAGLEREASVIVREITAGFGRHGACRVKIPFPPGTT